MEMRLTLLVVGRLPRANGGDAAWTGSSGAGPPVGSSACAGGGAAVSFGPAGRRWPAAGEVRAGAGATPRRCPEDAGRPVAGGTCAGAARSSPEARGVLYAPLSLAFFRSGASFAPQASQQTLSPMVTAVSDSMRTPQNSQY